MDGRLGAWVLLAALAGGVACEPRVASRVMVRQEPRSVRRWSAYESATCEMRVEFPGIAIESTEEVRTPNGSQLVETGTLDARGVDGTMVASCTRVGLLDAGLSALFDATRDALVKEMGARLLEERTSIGGRELRFSLEGHEIRARLIAMNGKLLTLIVAPVDAFGEETVVRFLESPRSVPDRDRVATGQRTD